MAVKVSTGSKARASWRGRVAQRGLAPARVTALRAWLLGTTALLPALGTAQAQAPNARPTGGQVVAGSASIGHTATTTTITQTTDRAAINWQQFNVGSQQSVTFQQPSAASWTLNRVVGADPSLIAGRITANGGVAIVNQSGVVFAAGAQVNVGSLIASAANITDQNFMNGRMVFDGAPNPGATVENHGNITVADRGLAALVGPRVHNSGVIRARLGRAALAGAETYSLDLAGDGLLSIDVTQAVRSTPAGTTALVTNSGTIEAAGGSVLITAHAASGLVEDLVRNTGTVSAATEAGRTGQVALRAQGGGVRVEGNVSATGGAGQRGGSIAVTASGTATVARGAVVDASGRAGGGTVAIGGANTRNARVEGKVTARGTGRRARGGTVTVQARESATVAATGVVDVSGAGGGGDIRLGTTGFGRDQTMAATTTLEEGGRLVADATQAGNGGTIAINSTTETRMLGTVSARGGAQGGNGGFIEVSALGAISFPSLSTQVDLAAPAGLLGTLLIDPKSITIIGGGGSPGALDDVAAGDTPANNLNIRAADIAATTGNLVLKAVETITVNANISKPLGDLTLRTTGTTGTPGIFVDANITIGTVGPPVTGGSLTLDSATGITVGGNIIIRNGSVTLTAATDIVVNNSVRASASSTFTATDSISLTATVNLGTANTLTLRSDGAISQDASGIITAGTLDIRGATGANAGAVTLDAANVVQNLAVLSSGAVSFTAANALAVTGVTAGGTTALRTTSGLLTISGTLDSGGSLIDLQGAGGISLGAQVNAGAGAVVLRTGDSFDTPTGTASITQSAGEILATSLAASAGGGITLDSATNSFGSLAAGRDRDGSAATQSVVSNQGGIAVTGATFAVAAPILAGTNGAIALTSSGTLTIDAAVTGTAAGITLTAADLEIGARVAAPGGAITIRTAAAGDMVGLGADKAVGDPDGIYLNATELGLLGGSGASGDTVAATRLRIVTTGTGDITLLGDTALRGRFGVLELEGGGAVAQTGGSLDVGRLMVRVAGDVDVARAGATNRIDEVAAHITAGTIAISSTHTSATTLTVVSDTGPGGTTNGIGGTTTPTAVTLTGNALALEAPVVAGTLTLTALDGGISQTSVGVITASSLSATATGAIALATANNAVTGNLIGTLAANSSGGGIAVFSRGALTTGAISAAGDVALTGTSLSLEDTLSASGQTITLRATTGGISQLAGAAITADVLDAGAVTGIALAAANDALTGNAIGSLTASTTSGGIGVFSGTAMTVTSGGVSAGAGGVALTGASLTLTGGVTASGQTVSLDATSGSITQGASGVVTATTLRATAGTLIDLSTANSGTTGNSIAAIGASATTGGVAIFSRTAFEVDAAGSGITAGAGSTIALAGPGITISRAIGFTAANAANLITLTADTLSATAGINAGATGTVRIAPVATNRAVEIAGTAIAGALQLSAATLGQVSAARLMISAGGTGGITLGGAFTASATALELIAGGSITQVSGATLTVAELAAIAGTASGNSITLTEANSIGAIVDSTSEPGFGLHAGGSVALTSTAALLTVDSVVQAGTLATPAGITLRADDLALNAALQGAGANLTTVTLLPHTAGTAVTLGGSAAGTFSLTNAELARIAAGTGLLRIGASGTAAGSFTAGAIDVAGDFTVRGHAAALDLRGRQVTQSGGVLDVATLTGATAAVNAVAAGGFMLNRTSGGVAVNSIDSIGTLGITAAGGDAALVTANALTMLGDVAATATTGANVLLHGAAGVEIGNGTDAVLVRAAGGDVTVQSGGAVVVNANAVLRAQDASLAAGTISLTGTTLTLAGTLDASTASNGRGIALTATDGRLLVSGSLEARLDITASVTGTVDGTIAGASPAISLGSASSLTAGGDIRLEEQTALASGLVRDIDARGSISAGGTALLATLTGSIAHTGTGSILAGTAAVLSATGSITHAGSIEATADARLTAGASITHSGSIAADGQARLTAGTSIDATGTISAGTLARLEAGTGGVSGGITLSSTISAATGDVSVLAHLGNISQTAGSLTALSTAPRGTVALVALAGDVSQSGTGRIQASQLIARASGTVALENFSGGVGNVIGRLLGTGATGGLDATAFAGGDPALLGSMAGGDFRLRTTSASLTVEGLVRAGTEVDSGGAVTVQTSGQLLRLLADDLVLDATSSPDGFVLRTPGGTVEIAPHTLGGGTPRQVVLGGAAGSTNAGALTLDSTEIGQIDTRFASGIGAGTLVVGRADSGALTVRGDVDLRDAPGSATEYGNALARRLVLASGGAVSQLDGTRVNVEQLAGLAGGSFVLDAANVINSVTGTATDVTAAGGSSAFTVAGISATGDVTLRVGGRAGTADGSLAASGTTPVLPPALDANGGPLAGLAALAINGAITTGGAGDITLRADDLAVNAALTAGATRRVVLQPVTDGQAILLGGGVTGTVGAEPTAGSALSLTQAELAQVSAGLLRIGGLTSLDARAASAGRVVQGQQAIDLTGRATTLEVLSAHGFEQRGALLAGLPGAGLTVANLSATIRTAERASGTDLSPASVWLGADNHIGRIGDTTGLASTAGIRLTIDRAVTDGTLPSNVVTIRQAAGQSLLVANDGIALNASGGRVTLIADRLLDFTGAVSVDAGTVELLPRTAGQNLRLGTAGVAADGDISAATLAQLNTGGGVLRIGRSVDAAVAGSATYAPIGGGDTTLAGIAGDDNSRLAGSITLAGNLLLRSAAQRLELYAGTAGEATPGSITQAAGTRLDISEIAGGSRGATALMNSGNTIDRLAARTVLGVADTGISFRTGTAATTAAEAVFALRTGSTSLEVAGQVSVGVGAGSAGDGDILQPGGTITLLADDMRLNAVLLAPDGIVALAPHTAGRHIALGRAATAAGSDELELGAAELMDHIRAGTLIIGRAPDSATLLGTLADGTAISGAGLPVAGSIRQYAGNIDFITGGGSAGAGLETNQGRPDTLTLVATGSIQQRGRSGAIAAETEGNGPDAGTDARGYLRVQNLTASAGGALWLGADNRIAALADTIRAGGIAGITVGGTGTPGVFVLRQARAADAALDGFGSGNLDNGVQVRGDVLALGGAGSRITLVSDALDIPAGIISAPSGIVEILPATAGRGITLGSFAAGTLSLLTTELARIGSTAGATDILRFGRSTDPAVMGNASWPTSFALGVAEAGGAGARTGGDITLAGDVILRDGADANRIRLLELYAGVEGSTTGTISQTAGALNVADLAGESRLSTTLASTTNRIDRLAPRSAITGEVGPAAAFRAGTGATVAADAIFHLVTTQALTVAGEVSVATPSISPDASGQQRAAFREGSILIGAASIDLAANLTAPPAFGSVLVAGPGSAVRGDTSQVKLEATAGGISQSGGRILAGRLSTQSTGSTILDAATNEIHAVVGMGARPRRNGSSALGMAAGGSALTLATVLNSGNGGGILAPGGTGAVAVAAAERALVITGRMAVAPATQLFILTDSNGTPIPDLLATEADPNPQVYFAYANGAPTITLRADDLDIRAGIQASGGQVVIAPPGGGTATLHDGARPDGAGLFLSSAEINLIDTSGTAANLPVGGTLLPGEFTLRTGGDVVIDGLNISRGLRVITTGDLTQTGAISLTSLSGRIGGDVMLDSSGNAIGVVRDLVAGGDVTIRNGAGLQLRIGGRGGRALGGSLGSAEGLASPGETPLGAGITVGAGRTITLRADDLDIRAPLTAIGGLIQLQPVTPGRTILIGQAVQADAGVMHLSRMELTRGPTDPATLAELYNPDRIVLGGNGVLRIGGIATDAGGSGASAGAIEQREQAIDFRNARGGGAIAGVLELRSGSSIGQTGAFLTLPGTPPDGSAFTLAGLEAGALGVDALVARVDASQRSGGDDSAAFIWLGARNRIGTLGSDDARLLTRTIQLAVPDSLAAAVPPGGIESNIVTIRQAAGTAMVVRNGNGTADQGRIGVELTRAGGRITLLADSLTLATSTASPDTVLRAPDGLVEIAPSTLDGTRAVVLGGTDAGALNLDSATLRRISAGILSVGRAATGVGIDQGGSGALTITGNVDLRDAPGSATEYANANLRTLVLQSSGAVSQTDGTRLNLERLVVAAGGAVSLDSVGTGRAPLNVVNEIGAAVGVTGVGAQRVDGGARSLAGISATGDVTLRVGGRAGTADGSLAASGTTPVLPPALDANGAPLAGVAALAINGAITTGGAGDITLRADDLAVNAALTAGATRRVVLQPVTDGQAILLGGRINNTVGIEPAAGRALSLLQAELAQVSAGLLRIGGLTSLDARAASAGRVVHGPQAIDLTGRATTLEVLSAYGFEQRGALLVGLPGAGLTVANLSATIRTAERASGTDLSPASVWLGADNHIGRIGDTTGLASNAGIRLTIDRAVTNGTLPSNVVTIRQAAGQSLLVANDGIALNAAGGRVTLIADRLLDFTGAVSVDAGTIELLPRTAGTALALGTASSTATGDISAATLAQLNTGGGVLRIGRSLDIAVAGSANYAPIGGGDTTLAGIAGADNSRLAGDIAISGDLALRGVAAQLELYAGTATGTNNGSITQAAGTRIDVARIAGASRFATTLDSAANTIDTLAPRSVLSVADTGIAFASGTGTSSADSATLGSFALRTAGSLGVTGQVTASHAAASGVADLALTAGTLTVGDGLQLQAARNVTLTAETTDILLGAGASVVTGSGNASLVAGRDIQLAAAAAVRATTGDTALTAGTGSITLTTGAEATAGRDLSLLAETGIDLATTALLRAGRHAGLTVDAGAIQIATGAMLQTDDGNATLSANSITNDGTITATGGSASLTATSGEIASTGTVSATLDLTLSATAGGITAARLTAGRDAGLTARDDITLGSLSAARHATLTSTTGDITGAAGASITATTGTATLTATAGAIDLAADATITAGTDAILSASTNIGLGSVTAARHASLTAGGGITLAENGLVQATTGALTVQAGGEIGLGDGAALRANAGTASITSTGGGIITGENALLLAGAGNLSVSASGGITTGSGTRIEALAGNATVTAGGAISLGDAAVLRASGTVSATGGTGLAIGDGGTVQGSTSVGLTATTGALGIGDGTGVRATTGGVTLQAQAGSITIGDGALVGAGNGNAVLTASQSITSGGLIDAAGAGATAMLTATGGAVTLLGSATADSGSIRATTNITVTAATGIAITGEQPATGGGFTSGILQAARGGTGNITLATATGDIIQSGGLISTHGGNAANTLNLIATTGAVRQVAASGAAIDTSRLTGQAGTDIELLAFSGGRDGAARGNRVDQLLGITTGGALQIQTVEAPTLITGPLQAGGTLQIWSEQALTIANAVITSTGTAVASAIGQGFNLDQLDTNARAGLVTLYSGGAVTVTNLVLNAEAAAIRAGVPMLASPATALLPPVLMLDGVAATIGSAITFAANGNITAGAPVTVAARGTGLPAAIFDSRHQSGATRLTLLETALGQVTPDTAGQTPRHQVTQVRNNLVPGAFGPASNDPAGDIALKVQMLARDGAGLQNQGAVFVLANAGNIIGSIDAGRLGVVGSGGTMVIDGRLNGQTGASAAQFADISQVYPSLTLQRYRINECVVTSINCVVPPAIQIVPPRQVDRANLIIETGRLNTVDIIIPNVSDEDDE